MIASLIVLLVVLAVGLAAAAAWGLRQRAALRVAQHRAEQGRSDGERLVTDVRGAYATLQAEHQLLRARAAETQRELGSLSYSISHDLRAPLRSVDGFSQALAEDYGHCLNPTAHDYLRRVRANAQHMSDLIDQLLSLSRISRTHCRLESVDLSALAKEAAAELSVEEPNRRVEWEIQPDVHAHGDRLLLSTALRHLLGNAWKFTARRPVAHIGFRVLPPAPAVSVDAARTSPVFQVRDDGVGFDMQYAGKLFGAFQRMHPPEDFPGHGIGLAAVQRIVRQHGGSIWVDAVPEQGAVFSFTLDTAVPDPSADASSHLLPTVPAADADTPSPLLPRTTSV